MERLRPVAVSISISTALNCSGPFISISFLLALPLFQRCAMMLVLTPKEECRVPHIPTSVMCAVPAGKIMASAVGTCQWSPMTAENRPST